MINLGKSEKTIRSYSTILRYSITAVLKLDKKIKRNLFEYMSDSDFEQINSIIWGTPGFIAVDIDEYNNFSAALTSYETFLKSRVVNQ